MRNEANASTWRHKPVSTERSRGSQGPVPGRT